ncbi:MAG TPA: CBS domain-containing protein [Acidimicrobiales bacterium]|nr:CBS domain-containing protein [Acidimicrobiales bacterium]
MAPEILHLSSMVHSPLLDRRGDRIGRIEDLIVRPGASDHPVVGGFVASIGGRELFVPISLVWELRPGRVQLQGETLNLGRFERRAGELLLVRDLAGRHLINLVGARLISANEIELACVEGTWQVVGVDPSGRGTLRRLLPRPLARRVGPGKIVDWASIQPFLSHVPTARLRIPYRKLAKLKPAQIADLVEAASHEEGEEIIAAVGQNNRELEADVFEELDEEHQREFLMSRSDEEAARLLATMEPDDAADLIVDLDQERRIPILEALPAPVQAKVRALLNYNPETAGGLMTPDFLLLAASATVGEALAALRESKLPEDALATVYLKDDEGGVAGIVTAVRLVKSDPAARLAAVAESDPVVLRTDADVHAIQRRMSDYNLSALPVVDEEQHLVGVITVDDVLELLLPTGWRRDYGMTGTGE